LRAASDSTSIECIAGGGRATDPSGMHVIRIDHVSLNAGDRAASLAWYADVLGLRAGDPHDVPDAPVFLGPAGARLALFADRAPGLRHVALATTAPAQAALVARLEHLGIAYHPERHRDSDSVYFADPDGTMLEVMVPRT
jgi:catechol 2,3-dioxygenase-like lactoylglutathione lyase family enzyme